MRPYLAQFSEELARLAARVRPSVVVVRSGSSVGAGVVVGRHRIATCAHVITAGGVVVNGGLGDLPARIIAVDPDNDVALLEAGYPEPALHLADRVRIGEIGLAIGSPGGQPRCGGRRFEAVRDGWGLVSHSERSLA